MLIVTPEQLSVDWATLAEEFALVFDLGGTLVDSAENLRVAANHVLSPVGVPTLSRADVIRHVADGQPLLIQRAVLECGGFGRGR